MKDRDSSKRPQIWGFGVFLRESSVTILKFLQILYIAFSVEFLNVVDFILLSKACLNGCIAEITYLDGVKNRIRAINILNPILKTWPKYSEKNAREIKEYDSMINKTFFLANEFEKKHSKPSWFENIVIQ